MPIILTSFREHYFFFFFLFFLSDNKLKIYMETGAKVLLISHVTGHICVHENNIFNLLKGEKV